MTSYLTPAPFDANAIAYAHAAWSHIFQFRAAAGTYSLSHLTPAQLLDVRLAIDVFSACVDAEITRQDMAAVVEEVTVG